MLEAVKPRRGDPPATCAGYNWANTASRDEAAASAAAFFVRPGALHFAAGQRLCRCPTASYPLPRSSSPNRTGMCDSVFQARETTFHRARLDESATFAKKRARFRKRCFPRHGEAAAGKRIGCTAKKQVLTLTPPAGRGKPLPYDFVRNAFVNVGAGLAPPAGCAPHCRSRNPEGLPLRVSFSVSKKPFTGILTRCAYRHNFCFAKEKVNESP